MRFQAALRLELVAALMAALALLLAGCGGDDDDEAGATTGATAAEEATDPAELGDVTLVVWDQEVRGGQAEAIKKLNQQFQQKYPNITLKRTAKSFTDLQATLKLQLESAVRRRVVTASRQVSRQILLANDPFVEVVRVAVAAPVAEILHEPRRRVAEVVRHRIVPSRRHIG